MGVCLAYILLGVVCSDEKVHYSVGFCFYNHLDMF